MIDRPPVPWRRRKPTLERLYVEMARDKRLGIVSTTAVDV